MNRNKSDSPKYYSAVTISLKTKFVTRNVKAIILNNGIFKPLIDYFIENQFKSSSWQNSVTYAVGLFIDYMITYQNAYSKSAKRRIHFLPDFIKLLHYGSINELGEDPFSLYWSPKKIYRVNQLENYLYCFLDWYYSSNKSIHETIFKSNYNELTTSEKVLYWRHWSNKKYTSMLSHLKKNNTAPKIFNQQKNTLFTSNIYDVKYFDNNKIIDLLFKGFKTSKFEDSYDIRNILITMLMHFGGCRLSEPFHLFVNDVIEDPQVSGKALVRVYHPEDGYIKYYDKYIDKVIETSRKDYLNKVYGLKPRNLESGTKKAGWKDLALDKTGKENYAMIYWFPDWTGKLFWELYQVYISQVLPKNLNNPYLFVSLKGKNHGQVYTINAYRDSHKKAVSKIGLSYAKEFGSTPHGHRHAYGQNLENAKVDPKIIQKSLHHKSPFSQLAYTLPSVQKINETLNSASININKNILGNNIEVPLDNLMENLLNHLNRVNDVK